MLSKALTSLRGFFLRFLGLTTLPTEIEFPGFISTVDWDAHLLALYRSRDPVSSPMQRSRMKTLKVTTIRHFKRKKHPALEYLVAEVFDPDLGQNRYLRIDRYVGDDFPYIHDTSRRNIPVTSSQSSLVLENPSIIDYVKAIRAWPTGDICIGKFTCQDSEMIALDLAIVAKVVHNHSLEYQLLTSQCYRYSAVIVSVLRRSFPQIKVSNNKKVPVDDSERPDMIREIHNLFETYKNHIWSWITEAEKYVERRADADIGNAHTLLKVIEGIEEDNKRVQKEKEDAERRANEAQKENERVQKEIAALKRHMQDIEAKFASGGGRASAIV